MSLPARLVLLFAAAGAAAAQTAQRPWSQGDPTPEEQQTLEWLNAARRDPVATLDRLLGMADSDDVIAAFLAGEDGITAAQLEGALRSAWSAAQAASAQYPRAEAISTAPLAFYPLFQQEAERWSSRTTLPPPDVPPQRPVPDYLYPTPLESTLLSGPSNVLTGPNATGGTAVFGPYGATYTEVAQANLYDPSLSGREYVLSLLCRPGSGSPPPAFLRQGDTLPDLTLGHTRLAGIAIGAAAAGGRTLTLYQGSSEFFTQSDLPFGGGGTVFITGVAFQDNNGNGVYDPGEGVAQVRITPDRGGWCAVTASAGGYAIPVPANSGTYVLTASGGPFAGATATVSAGGDNVKVDWVAPAPAPALPPQTAVPGPDGETRLIGLSTRGLVQTGATALVAGFVIAGPASAQKTVLIRGVGPSLQTVNFPAAECVPATQIQLYDHTGRVLAANAGWTSAADGGAAVAAAAARVGEFPLLRSGPGGGDSALLAALSPGAYTVAVSPPPGTPEVFLTGRVGLAEVYDVSLSDGSRFVNVSSRGEVGTGDAQLIVGCTVAGSGHKRLLLRGVGLPLAAWGVTGTLPNPVLTLYDSQSRALGSNDDWSLSPQTDQIRLLATQCGAFALPEGSADSSLLALVAPGNYTAIVGAKPGTTRTGVALVELYETP